jgi:hypothetical protein
MDRINLPLIEQVEIVWKMDRRTANQIAHLFASKAHSEWVHVRQGKEIPLFFTYQELRKWFVSKGYSLSFASHFCKRRRNMRNLEHTKEFICMFLRRAHEMKRVKDLYDQKIKSTLSWL